MHIVIAASYAAAVEYARRQGWSTGYNKQWSYAWNISHLMGIRGATIHKVGNYEDNPIYQTPLGQKYVERLERSAESNFGRSTGSGDPREEV